MKYNKQSKKYKTPQFQLVRQDKSNKVFFVASGKPVIAKFVSGTLPSIKKVTGTW